MRTKILKKALSLALTVIISGSVSAFNPDIINAVLLPVGGDERIFPVYHFIFLSIFQ